MASRWHYYGKAQERQPGDFMSLGQAARFLRVSRLSLALAVLARQVPVVTTRWRLLIDRRRLWRLMDPDGQCWDWGARRDS